MNSNAARIHKLDQAEQEREPDLFTQEITVDANVLAQVVEHIQAINFNKTDLDTKGVAFEEFKGVFSKAMSGSISLHANSSPFQCICCARLTNNL